jgi:hypothetical protein
MKRIILPLRLLSIITPNYQNKLPLKIPRYFIILENERQLFPTQSAKFLQIAQISRLSIVHNDKKHSHQSAVAFSAIARARAACY